MQRTDACSRPPLAAGLFHRAILESGTGMDDAVELKDAAEAHGLQIAGTLGVEGTDTNAARVLRAISPEWGDNRFAN